jgi:hypothetical protein
VGRDDVRGHILGPTFDDLASRAQAARLGRSAAGRWLLVTSTLALLWLFVFAAESRADDLVGAVTAEAVETIDADASATTDPAGSTGDTAAIGDASGSSDLGSTDQVPADSTTAPPADSTTAPPADSTTAPPADSTTPPPVDATPPPVDATPPPVDATPPPVDATPPPSDLPPVEVTPPEPPGLPVELPNGSTPSEVVVSVPSGAVLFGPSAELLDTLAGDGHPLIGAASDGPRSSGSNRASDQLNAGNSGRPEPTPQGPPSPRTPWPQTPFGPGAGAGAFGGSGGGSGSAPIGVLAVLILFFAFAQRLGSRLWISAIALCPGSPAFQLTRPG